MSTRPAAPRRLPSNRVRIAGLALILAVPTACATPFSDYQSARLVDEGKVDITASYGQSHFRDDGESDKVQDEFGLQVAFRVADNAELRAKYFLMNVDAEGESTANALGFGPKFSLVEDRLALYTPVGFAFGGFIDDGGSTWQLQPTLIGNLYRSDQFEVNASGKYIFWFDQDIDDFVAFNLGFGIGPLERWAIRPEVGFLLNPGDSGSFIQFGLGASFAAGGND